MDRQDRQARSQEVTKSIYRNLDTFTNNFCFSKHKKVISICGHNRMPRIRLAPPPTINNYKAGQAIWNYVFCYWTQGSIRLWALKEGKLMKCVFWLLWLFSRDNFLIMVQEAGAQTVHGSPLELRRQRSEFRAVRVAGIYMGRVQEKRELLRSWGIYVGKKLWKFPSGPLLGCTCIGLYYIGLTREYDWTTQLTKIDSRENKNSKEFNTYLRYLIITTITIPYRQLEA